jgi:hypothetical protein
MEQQQIDEHITHGAWRDLEALALKIVESAERGSGLRMAPVLGGGTRLMLALRHRLSDDIDLFIRDPQWIGYLTPRLNDEVGNQVLRFEESSDFLKLSCETGEIDFIVRMSLLGDAPQSSALSAFQLEPVAEVIAKKLFYRGWALTARDLYDWWAVHQWDPEQIDSARFGGLLKGREEIVDRALQALPDSSAGRAQWGGIRAVHKPAIEGVSGVMRERLQDYVRAASASVPVPAKPRHS